jgi:hypothetical protein
LTAPVEVPVVAAAKVADAEAGLLALHVAGGLVGPGPGHDRVARLLGHDHRGRHGGPDEGHGREQRPALAPRADQAAVGRGERERDRQQGQRLQEVGDRVGVLVRVGRVGVVEAAAVGAELLDRLLGGDRPAGQGLGGAADGGHLAEPVEVLDNPPGHQEHAEQD